MPATGQGSWKTGDFSDKKDIEIKALRTGIECGMTLIDTAEMYGNGKSESLVGEAIAPYDREKLFIISKVLPHNAGRKAMRSSCEQSLKRLKTDYLDMYLYHWRGNIPLRETVECLQQLKESGLIREWGVSNFDLADMQELEALEYGCNCSAFEDLAVTVKYIQDTVVGAAGKQPAFAVLHYNKALLVRKIIGYLYTVF